jgi:cob(I)alamin adenosyltransferase
MLGSKGLVQVYTGNGKGKTTSALGLAMRASGQGARVIIIQFMKSGEGYGELKSLAKLDGVTLISTGHPGFTRRGEETPEDFAGAERGLALARKYAEPGACDMLILDEINVALDRGLLKTADVVEFVKNKPEDLELVMTGRGAKEEILGLADLVSEIREVRHPYHKGIEARRGVEY